MLTDGIHAIFASDYRRAAGSSLHVMLISSLNSKKTIEFIGIWLALESPKHRIRIIL